MANLLPFEVTMMATKVHFALFLVAQAYTFLSLWRRGKDGRQTWTQVLHLLVKGPQSLFAHSCETGVLPHGRDSINASFSGLRDIRHLINAGFLCPLLRSSGLHQDTIPGSGPVVPIVVAGSYEGCCFYLFLGKVCPGCGDAAASYYYLLWFWLSRKCS